MLKITLHNQLVCSYDYNEIQIVSPNACNDTHYLVNYQLINILCFCDYSTEND